MNEKKYALIGRKYREFFWPTIAMSMANNMALFVDSVLVSTFVGVADMPAVQLCFPVVAFVNIFYWMFGIGGSLLVSTAQADHEMDKANRLYSVSMVASVGIAIFIAAIGSIFRPGLVSLLCQNPDLTDKVTQYSYFLFLGLPMLSFIMSLSYFARSDGSPKIGFYAVLISNVVNLCMDVVLMKFCHMGLFGAALATFLGYIAGILYMFRYIFSKDRTLKFVNPFRTGLFFFDAKAIAAKGFPTASSQLYTTIRTYALNAIVTKYGGSYGLSVYSIYKNSLFVAYIIFIGTAQTLSPIVTVYTHEGDYDRARFVLKRSLRIAVTGAVVLGALLAIFPQITVFLYRVQNPDIVTVLTSAIRLYVLSYPGLAFYYIMSYYFQAIKRQRLSGILTVLEGLVFPVVLCGIFAPLFELNGVWAGVIGAETAAALIILLYLTLAKRKDSKDGKSSFLLPAVQDEQRFEFTVCMNIEESVRLSFEAGEWVKQRIGEKKAVLTCLAVEEMLTGIVMANSGDSGEIDVVLREENHTIVITMRDLGRQFNPTIYDRSLAYTFENAAVLNRIASEIKYDRSLGMNATLIRLK